MPEMQQMKPCARCEQELPESFFDADDSMFCKKCTGEVTDIIRKKYSVIEAAHFRAGLRLSSRKLKDKMTTTEVPAIAVSGD
ncbi:MAG: hypothetical protein ACPG7F_13000 [Aggregatilineales bacterium]